MLHNPYKEIKNDMLSKTYTFIVVSFPILSMYIVISSLTLGDLLLLSLFPILLFQKRAYTIKTFLSSILSFYFLYIFCQFYILYSFDFISSNDVVLRTLRYLFYILCIILFSKRYFIPDYALVVYKYIAVFACLFLILQLLCLYFFNYYLPGYLPIFSVREDLLNFSFTSVSENRARSIFAEPAEFSTYIVTFLAIQLFSIRKNKNDLLLSLFLTISVFLSLSSTGILVSASIWLFWFVMNRAVPSHIKISGIALLLFFLFLFSKTDLFSSILIERLQTGSSSMNGRFNGYDFLFHKFRDSNFMMTWGEGMDRYDDIYLPGFVRLTYYFGLIGLCIFLIVNFWYYKKSNFLCRVLIIIILGLNVGTAVVFSPAFLFYYSFIIVNKKKKKHTLINKDFN